MNEPDQSPPNESQRGPALLAFDWAEGLCGPRKAHGLPRPLRLGERAPAEEAVLLLSEEELADDAQQPAGALEEPVLLDDPSLLIPLDENGEEQR
jgi:hypothetical protein